MDKLQKMEQELKNITAENLKDQELIFEERQKSLEKEKQRLASEMQALKSENEKLASARTGIEQEFEKKLAEQKKQFQEQIQKSVSELQEKQTEELQRKFFQQEQELLEKKKKLEEDAKKSIVTPPPVVVPPSAVKKMEDLRKSVDIPAIDPAMEEKLRKMYQALVQTGEQVFQYIQRESTVELGFLSKVLGEVLDLLEEHDQELLSIVLEPYPSLDYFVYHSANCSILSMIIGIEMKLGKEELKELALAGFVHDCGLLGIKENLDYPKQLTTAVKNEIMQHPQRTVEMLGEKINENIKAAILQHHETVNGKGYPGGLTGDDIHVYARIILIADSFEAMTHHRPYRPKAMEVSEAMKEMVDRGRGVYDREALKSLMSRIGLYPIMSLVELSNKQIARVVRQCRKFPLSPVVKIEFDEDGNKLRTPQVIDLSKNQLIHIMGPVGSATSYGNDRQQKQKQKHSHQHAPVEQKKTAAIWDFIPFVVVILALLALVYLVLKL